METLLNNLIQAMGWSILHSLWQSALIYALLLPLQLLIFRRNARVKYIMAYAAHSLMFISFLITFFSVFHWPSPATAVPVNPLAAMPGSISYIAVMATRFAAYAETAFPYLVMCYLLGFIVQSVVVIKGYKRVQALKNAVHQEIPAHWKVLFAHLLKELKIKKPIAFRLSEYVNVPLVIGFLKPVILFPVSLAAQMDIQQVEAILIHELSHIRRNDYLFNLIRTVIDTILFFNPFVWLTGKFIDIEREHACDDLVVKVTSTPLTYAHALLTLELLSDKSSPALALAASGNDQHLYQRIKRITDMKTNYINSKQKLFAITLTIATIVSLAWISPEKKEKPVKAISIRQITKTIAISELSLLDTGKKKLKKVMISGNRVLLPVPPKPKTPPTPEKPEEIEVPEAPEPPEMPAIDMDIIAPVSASIDDFAKKVTILSLSGQNKQEDIRKMQIAIEKQGEELQKKFNSPEQKARWAKYTTEMQAKFNSKEQQAKWKKYGEEMRAKYDNPKERAKWEKLAREQEQKFNSKEQKLYRIQLNNNIQQNINAAKTAQSIALTQVNQIQKVEQSPEYIELKKKFDQDLQDLYQKKLKEEKN